MTVHNAMTGSELHETKGAAAAQQGHVLVASGVATAVYQALLGNVVFVNQLSDFPTPSSGKIALLAATCYLIGANINIGTDYLEFSAGTSLAGMAPFLSSVTYTGTVPMMQGEDVSATIKNLTVISATADLFAFSETGSGGTKILLVEGILVIACLTVGTFDKFGTTVVEGMTVLGCTDGMVVTGAVQVGFRMVSLSMTSTSSTFIGFDFTGATVKTVNIDGVILSGGAGSIGIKGDAASANIETGFIANVSNVQFDGVTTPLSGIAVEDIRWNFQSNGTVQDSIADAMVSLTGNSTTTTLTVGVPSLIAGTWVDERASHFTNTTGGRATYTGERDLVVPIDAAVTLAPDSGTGKVIRAYFALNGTVIVASGKAIELDTADPLEITLMWQLNLTKDDFIEVFIENETDSIDVTVNDAVLRIR